MKKLMVLSFAMLFLASSGWVSLRSAPDEPMNLKELSNARLKLAHRAFDNASRMIDQVVSGNRPDAGAYTVHDLTLYVEDLIAWSTRWMDSERDLDPTPKGEAVAANAHVGRLQEHATRLEAAVGKGAGISQLHIDLLNYSILDAKAQLLKARDKR
jgi:hypothetical protein